MCHLVTAETPFYTMLAATVVCRLEEYVFPQLESATHDELFSTARTLGYISTYLKEGNSEEKLDTSLNAMWIDGDAVFPPDELSFFKYLYRWKSS